MELPASGIYLSPEGSRFAFACLSPGIHHQSMPGLQGPDHRIPRLKEAWFRFRLAGSCSLRCPGRRPYRTLRRIHQSGRVHNLLEQAFQHGPGHHLFAALFSNSFTALFRYGLATLFSSPLFSGFAPSSVASSPPSSVPASPPSSVPASPPSSEPPSSAPSPPPSGSPKPIASQVTPSPTVK